VLQQLPSLLGPTWHHGKTALQDHSRGFTLKPNS
jgi:hypothetical protein